MHGTITQRIEAARTEVEHALVNIEQLVDAASRGNPTEFHHDAAILHLEAALKDLKDLRAELPRLTETSKERKKQSGD